MPQQDGYGLSLSTDSDAAASAYRDGIDCVLSGWPGAAEAFDRALQSDTEFALAHAARARGLFLTGARDTATDTVALATRLVDARGTERERSHVAVLAAGIEGRADLSLKRALAHLERWPRDALVMSLPLGAFGLFAFSGMPDHDSARVTLCERHKVHYGDDWWFLTNLGWAHTESGNVRVGRAITERAVSLRKENAHGIHALAHAMFEDGSGEADAMIGQWLSCYAREGVLHGHLCWHAALTRLDRGDVEGARALYAANIRPTVTKALPLNVVSDTAGFLWRLKLAGLEVAAQDWAEALDYAAPIYRRGGFAFADLHMAMLEAEGGRADALNARIEAVERMVDAGTQPCGAVALAILHAVRALAADDPFACAGALEPLAHEVVRIGGSHAQREIVEDTLLVAWMRAGRIDPARALLASRLARRPSLRDRGWLDALPG